MLAKFETGRQLGVMVLLTTIVALGLASAGFIAYERLAFERTLSHEAYRPHPQRAKAGARKTVL